LPRIERSGGGPYPYEGGGLDLSEIDKEGFMKRLLRLVPILLLLSGCASTIEALGKDSAIVGTTGTWIVIGMQPSTIGVPFPSVKFGYGTIWRIGPHENVEIMIGGTAGLPTDQTASRTVSGNASLYIKVTGKKKAHTITYEEKKVLSEDTR